MKTAVRLLLAIGICTMSIRAIHSELLKKGSVPAHHAILTAKAGAAKNPAPQPRKAEPAKPQVADSAPRNSQAVGLAASALNALVGHLPIADATVKGDASYIAGSDRETGTATLEAHAGYESRTVLDLTDGKRSEVRNGSGAPPQRKTAGPDGNWHAAPLHNCWTDETWFFPALMLQSALSDPQISFAYVDQETKNGISAQHIQISRVVPGQAPKVIALIQRLSQVDFYLDPTTGLPVAIDFNTHPEKNAAINLPVEIQFSGWHPVNGIELPAKIQKFLQGSLTLDLSNLTISVNTGVPQSDFTMTSTISSSQGGRS